jgi:uncharacterized phiE125 gp8 family phage protein
MPTEATPLPQLLATLDQAREYLKRDDESDDEMIRRVLNYATGWIYVWTGRRLLSQSYTDERLDGTGGSWITARQWPVTTVTAIHSVEADGTTLTALDTTGAHTSGGVITLPNDTFPRGERNILLDYTAGYLAGTHDHQLQALQGACLRLVQCMWMDQDSGAGRTMGINVATGGVTFLDVAMPRDVAQMLGPFRRVL